MIGRLRKRLAAAGVADDTYIVFSSDNGFHLGQHRLTPGKLTAYDPDVRVPLIVTGPGVPAGRTVDAMTETEPVDHAHLLIRSRARHGEQSLTLALNLTGEPFALADSVEVLEAEPEVAAGAVAPHGWAVIAG